jgi:hypothetical protein
MAGQCDCGLVFDPKRADAAKGDQKKIRQSTIAEKIIPR